MRKDNHFEWTHVIFRLCSIEASRSKYRENRLEHCPVNALALREDLMRVFPRHKVLDHLRAEVPR